MKKMKIGFTLAELLIVLAVIGIIAAITLPALQANIQRNTLNAAAGKAKNTITNALSIYMSEQGADTLNQLNFQRATFAGYLKGTVAGANVTMNDESVITLPAAGMAAQKVFTVDVNGPNKGPGTAHRDIRTITCNNIIMCTVDDYQ